MSRINVMYWTKFDNGALDEAPSVPSGEEEEKKTGHIRFWRTILHDLGNM